MNLADLVLSVAERSPDAVAVEMAEQRLTYGQFVSESARVAAGLQDSGVRTGERVMLFAENCLEYLVIYHACARLGAVFVPVHASFQVNELEHVLANASPTVVIADDLLWDRLERCQGSLPSRRVTLGAARPDTAAYRDLGQELPAAPVRPLDPSAPVLICYTSGSTDRPLPVTRSHATEVWNAKTYADVWDYRPDDRALVTLPLSWVYGLTTLSQGLLAVGATVVLHTEFVPEAVLDEMERSGVTLFAGTMSMYVGLAGALQHRNADLSSLRRLYRGGEALNSAVAEVLERRTGIRLSDGYATTEVAPVLAVDPLRDVRPPAGTAGRLVPGARIRIVDEAGNDVAPGEVGEAWLGGPGLMLGYWNQPDVTAECVTADGWFRSGDLLREGPNGYFFVLGRSSEIIIRNGARVAPAEIEAALADLPSVADCAAVGVPDEDFGESIVAFVVVQAGCLVTVDDLYVYLADRIARFKLPTDIIFVDALPLRRNEKRDRLMLRELALELLESNSSAASVGA